MALRFTRLMLLAPALAVAGLTAPQLSAQPVSPPPMVSAPAAPKPAELQPKIYLSPDGTVIYLIGEITDGAFMRFDAVLSKAPKARTLFLSSPGGRIVEARLIAAEIRKFKLNTYVEFYCASACTQLFAAGRERVIGKDGMLGFHQAYGVDSRGRPTKGDRPTKREISPTTEFWINGSDNLRLAYELAGFDSAFIDKALTKSFEEMWLPSVQEMTDARVITRQAQSPEFPLPEGSISKAELRTLLAKRPLWDRAARLFPKAYDSGFTAVWRLTNSGSPLNQSIGSGRSELVVAMMTRLSQASDSVIDRHLTLYAAEAAAQAKSGYDACLAKADGDASGQSESDLRFEQTEDQLLVEALDTPPAVALMSSKEALKVFSKEIMPLLPDGFTSSNSCKAGFQMVEAIGRLTGKKRIKVYRAMLFLPDAMGV